MKYKTAYQCHFNKLVLLMSLLFLNSPILGQTSALAQPTTNSNDWSKFPAVEKQFMNGCTGEKNLSNERENNKIRFCRCVFNFYKARYTPQLFAQINALAVKLGQDGPRLVNMMMEPELKQCSEITNFTRP